MLRFRLLAGALMMAVLVGSACEPTNQGYAPQQPVAYSHAVHAGGARIDCLYCHYGAERGRFAGIPPARICTNCHAQIQPRTEEVDKVIAALEQQDPIEWVRVHLLPDHAAFDHSAHVVTAELRCQECHGDVQGMGIVRQDKPLTMGWCLDCHRQQQPGPLPGPAPATGIPPQRAELTDCVVCHH